MRVWNWFRNNNQLYIPVQYINRKNFMLLYKIWRNAKNTKYFKKENKSTDLNIDLKEIHDVAM